MSTNSESRALAVCSWVSGPNPWSPHPYLCAPIDAVRKIEDDLALVQERADLLTFLQTEGYAWPDDYIRRHRAICKEKRDQQGQQRSQPKVP